MANMFCMIYDWCWNPIVYLLHCIMRISYAFPLTHSGLYTICVRSGAFEMRCWSYVSLRGETALRKCAYLVQLGTCKHHKLHYYVWILQCICIDVFSSTAQLRQGDFKGTNRNVFNLVAIKEVTPFFEVSVWGLVLVDDGNGDLRPVDKRWPPCHCFKEML
mgnify:CR=1 FL=1